MALLDTVEEGIVRGTVTGAVPDIAPAEPDTVPSRGRFLERPAPPSAPELPEGFVPKQPEPQAQALPEGFVSREQAQGMVFPEGFVHKRRDTELLSVLQPMMERVASEWGVKLVGASDIYSAGEAAKLNDQMLGMVKDEAIKRIQAGPVRETLQGLGDAASGLIQSATDPAMMSVMAASYLGGPEVGLPVTAAFLGKALGQAGGTLSVPSAPLRQKIAETAQAAVLTLPFAFPGVRGATREAVNRMAQPTDLTVMQEIRQRLAPRSTEAVQGAQPPGLPGAPPRRAPLSEPREPLPRTSLPRGQQVLTDPLAGEYRVVDPTGRHLTPAEVEAAEALATQQIEQAWPQMTVIERENALRGRGIPQRLGGRAPNDPNPQAYASQNQPTAEVHGPVRPQPGPGPGQVPIPPGGGGVQPQAQGGLRKPETPAPGPQVIGLEEPGARVQPTPPEQLPTPLRAQAERLAQGQELTPEEERALEALRTSNPAHWEGFYAYLQTLPRVVTGAGLATEPPKPGGLAEPPATQLMVPGEKPGQLIPYRGAVAPPEPGLAAGIPRALLPEPTLPPEEPWQLTLPEYRSRPYATQVDPESVFATPNPEPGQFRELELRAAVKAAGAGAPEGATEAQLLEALRRQAGLNSVLARSTLGSLSGKPTAFLDPLLRSAGLPLAGTRAEKAGRLLAYRERLAQGAEARLTQAKHELAVRTALEEGEPVPAHVLKEYGIKPPAGPKDEPEPTGGVSVPQQLMQFKPTPDLANFKHWLTAVQGKSEVEAMAIIDEIRAKRTPPKPGLLEDVEEQQPGRNLPHWFAQGFREEVSKSITEYTNWLMSTKGYSRAQAEAIVNGFYAREPIPPEKPMGTPSVDLPMEAKSWIELRSMESRIKDALDRGEASSEEMAAQWRAKLDQVRAELGLRMDFRKSIQDMETEALEDMRNRIAEQVERLPRGQRARLLDQLQAIKTELYGRSLPYDAERPDPGPEPGDPPEVAQQKAQYAFGPASAGAVATGPHGLPAGVPTRGPLFVTHLLEATRRLGALARSALLRPGHYGTYARNPLAQVLEDDKIYLGDVRNQRSMGHEMFHGLDALVFQGKGALRTSKESLFTRLVGTGNVATKQRLFDELKSVSELMRGPMGTSEYRARASELIADWGSLYVHDPARARAMAPHWSTGFEKALADPAFADAAETVRQVLAGEVTPVSGELPPAGSSVTHTAQVIPGRIPARPINPPVTHDIQAAMASEAIVRGGLRTLESQLQRARVWIDNMVRLVPHQSDRYDVGAFIEGIGRLDIAGDDIAQVRARMTPAKEELARQYRYRTELGRQFINYHLRGTTPGEYLKFAEDYMGHFYLDKPHHLAAAMSRFLKESPHAKQRLLPNLKEAVDLGLHPITQDPLQTYEMVTRTNWRVATNRKVIAQLRNLTTLSGDPVIMPKGKAPPDWPTSDNPLIQRVYARRSGEALHLWRGGAAIHPDVFRSVRQLLERPAAGRVGKLYDAINAITRGFAFSFSGFHDVSLRMASVGAGFRMSNPYRGFARIFERNPVTHLREPFRFARGVGKQLLMAEDTVADAAEHGLRFAWTDSEAYQHAARGFVDRMTEQLKRVPYLGKGAHLARAIIVWRQKALWRNTHDAYKILAYNDIVTKALDAAPPGADVRAIKERTASLLNDAFGGQAWQERFWLDPYMRRLYSRFMLAPDWTLSTLRSVPLLSDLATAARTELPKVWGRTPLPGVYEGVGGNLARLKFWGAEVLAVASAAIAAQYAFHMAFGDRRKGDRPWIWQNEYGNRYTVDVTPVTRHYPWADPNDPTRHYINLGKRASEVLRWVVNPAENIEAKLSRPIAEFYKQLSSMEGKFKAPWQTEEEHATFPETALGRAKSIAKEFLPFTFTGNQFALTVPQRKGMTAFKAENIFESIYEVAADPNAYRRWAKSILRGQPLAEGDLVSMVQQVSDAAIRNGVTNPEVLRERALSKVRSRYLIPLYKGLHTGRESAEMREAIERLARLDTRYNTIRESIRRKLAIEAAP